MKLMPPPPSKVLVMLTALFFVGVIGLLQKQFVATAALLPHPTTSTSQAFLPIIREGHQSLLCRFGVNVIRDVSDIDLADLRIGWYVDYFARMTPLPINSIDYVRVIRLTQTGPNSFTYAPDAAEILAVVAANPGSEWLIGNEPDRRDFQDDMEPHVYALAYHDLYELLKTADPTTRVFAGTIVQPTPLRLQYLDIVLDTYQQVYTDTMPVDGWSIHNFILNEVSCDYDPTNCWGAGIPPGIDAPFGQILTIDDNDNFDIFTQRIEEFRQWMADNGYGGLPIYLSEYGILMPEDFGFPPERVNTFMNNSFNYMLNATDPVLGDPHDGYRLIQKWSWYSTGAPGDLYNGYLYEPTSNQLSAMGENFGAYTTALEEEIDFYPTAVFTQSQTALTSGGTVTVTLQATIANSGNLARDSRAVVRFYDGDPEASGNQIGTDQDILLEGCGDNQVALVTWTNVSPGTYEIYVSIDSEDFVPETSELNNVIQQTVVINP